MLAFTNANLIDGTGAKPVTGSAVIVDDKKIVSVGRSLDVPRQAFTIDLAGKTLMPGLMEGHAHLGGRDYPPGLDNAKNSWDYAPMRDLTLASGVTTIRSCGDWMKDTIGTREKIESGLLRGPRLVCSGAQFQRPDAHPSRTVWGNDPDTCANAGMFPTSPEEARAQVRVLKEAGVDFVKIIVADSFVFIFPEYIEPLSDDIIQAIIDEAHEVGLWVMCHVDDPMAAAKVVRYGADEINHLISMGIAELPDERAYDELFELMLDRGTWFMPTITIVREYNHLILEKGAPATIDDYFVPHYRKAYEAGVRMGCGCDSGAPDVPWGPALHAELGEYVHGLGMSPLEAISCVTKNNSVIFGIDQKVGVIKEGMLADLLVVDGDPSTTIEDVGNIRMVVKEGSVVVDKMLA